MKWYSYFDNFNILFALKKTIVMSLLDDEDILMTNNNPILNELAKDRAKYLSYGFWCKRILEPAIKQINNGCCDLDLYVAHPDLNNFIETCKKISFKENVLVHVIDCNNINILAMTINFIQQIPNRCLIIILNPSLLPYKTVKNDLKNILFNCWKDKEINVEQLLKDNNAGEYIIENGNKKLHRDNYGIIYLDSDKNKDFNFRTLSGTECYGDFFIPGCNYTFMNTCYYDEVVNIKELVDYGETFLNSRK